MAKTWKIGDRVIWRDWQRLEEGLPEDKRVWIIHEVREDMLWIHYGKPGESGYAEAEVPLQEIDDLYERIVYDARKQEQWSVSGRFNFGPIRYLYKQVVDNSGRNGTDNYMWSWDVYEGLIPRVTDPETYFVYLHGDYDLYVDSDMLIYKIQKLWPGVPFMQLLAWLKEFEGDEQTSYPISSEMIPKVLSDSQTMAAQTAMHVMQALKARGVKCTCDYRYGPVRKVLRDCWYVEKLADCGQTDCLVIDLTDAGSFIAVTNDCKLMTGYHVMIQDAIYSIYYEYVESDVGFEPYDTIRMGRGRFYHDEWGDCGMLLMDPHVFVNWLNSLDFYEQTEEPVIEEAF